MNLSKHHPQYPQNTMDGLRLIYEDMLERGLKDEPAENLSNYLSSFLDKNNANFLHLMPTDLDVINMFCYACHGADQSILGYKFSNGKEFPINCVADYNEGDGNLAEVVWEYVTLQGYSIYIVYRGTYSSWDSTSYDYMHICLKPKIVTSFKYINSHSNSIAI